MYVCMYVCACMYVCMYVRTYVRTHARTHVRTYARTYVCTYVLFGGPESHEAVQVAGLTLMIGATMGRSRSTNHYDYNVDVRRYVRT